MKNKILNIVLNRRVTIVLLLLSFTTDVLALSYEFMYWPVVIMTAIFIIQIVTAVYYGINSSTD